MKYTFETFKKSPYYAHIYLIDLHAGIYSGMDLCLSSRIQNIDVFILNVLNTSFFIQNYHRIHQYNVSTIIIGFDPSY